MSVITDVIIDIGHLRPLLLPLPRMVWMLLLLVLVEKI